MKDVFNIVISIDGLDGVGKTTFAKNLNSSLNEAIQREEHGQDFRIIYQHFPRYETRYGKEILYILKNEDLNDVDVLDRLILDFVKDREEFWELFNTLYSTGDKKVNILIADRYRISNLIYNSWRLLPRYKDIKEVYDDMTRNENKYNVKLEDIPVIMVGSRKMRETRLNQRSMLDQNEKDQVQESLENSLMDILKYNVIEDPLIVLADELDFSFSSFNGSTKDKLNLARDFNIFYENYVISRLNKVARKLGIYYEKDLFKEPFQNSTDTVIYDILTRYKLDMR